jgi:hypothetical protein
MAGLYLSRVTYCWSERVAVPEGLIAVGDNIFLA